jgi:hypothetical protein
MTGVGVEVAVWPSGSGAMRNARSPASMMG